MPAPSAWFVAEAREVPVDGDPGATQRLAGVRPGAVVLSERAGAAQEMFDALVVNPHHVEAAP